MARLRPRFARYFVLLVAVVLAACTTSVPSPAPPTHPPETTAPVPTASASAATIAPKTPLVTETPAVATPTVTPKATPDAWIEIQTNHIAWSPDGTRFVTAYSEGTELRNAAFDVIRTYPQLRRAAWLDATHLVGYQSPVDYLSDGYTSSAVPVIVEVETGATQDTDMPFGVSDSPLANGLGAAVVASPTNRIEWHYQVWSPDRGSTPKREGGQTGWSNDGSKLAINHTAGMAHWPQMVSWPDGRTLYQDRTINFSGTMDFDPLGNYVSFDVRTGDFATVTHAIRIVDLRSAVVADVAVGEANVSWFWTADGRLSVLDRDTLAVRVFDPDGTKVDSYVAPFPDVWASDDGSSVAFLNEEDMTQAALVRGGHTTFLDAPATGAGSVYFSPDGSVMVFWTDTDPILQYLRRI